ncbi:YfbU family protein [Aestuariibius insulae]|uniref:YfbU family protein n=1 Tax=Aestuariibius insulae TaxID=2058287 RepID=UPI00345E9482
MKLSKFERVSLIYQHMVMRDREIMRKEECDLAIEILSNGYELLYGELYGHVYDDQDVMSVDECSEVFDTLSMFEGIDSAIQDLSLDHEAFRSSKFHGYDGNNEAKFKRFAEFLMTKERRFSDLPTIQSGNLNSHMPVRARYRDMLQEWKAISAELGSSISRESLERVLDQF